MNDMSATIVAKSDQINAADLVGGPITVTVREVRIKANEDQPVSLLLEGYDKCFRPCKGVRRLLVNAWGADANNYLGCSLTLYRDPEVTWAGKQEGGIRVSHMSHVEKEFVEWMRTSRAATKPYKIKPLEAAPKQNGNAKQTPEEWVNGHIAKVGEATDLAAVDALIAVGKKAVAKLEADAPELRERVLDAYSARINALEAAKLTDEGAAADEALFGDAPE